MKKCAIITAYVEGDPRELLSKCEDTFIIAADGGVKHALKHDIPIDLIIGDFDSYEGELPSNVPIIRFKPEKDDTDTGLSVTYAIDRGFDDITIIGGIGGRLDHTIANIQVLAGAALRGVQIEIRDKGNTASVIKDGSVTLQARPNTAFSLFSLSERCLGVNICNAKYPLHDHELVYSFPLGCSNEFAGGPAEISVAEGTLLIVVSQKK